VRSLVLLRVADLLLDVLTGFVALYLVDVAGAPPAWAAGALALRLGASLVGEAALLPLLGRVPGRALLVSGTAVAAIAYPAFLVAPGLPLKLIALGALSIASAPWYPLLQARLYAVLPGESAVAVTLDSAAGFAGGLAPLALGLAATRFGLGPALGALATVPLALLAGLLVGAKGPTASPGQGDALGHSPPQSSISDAP
jgi:FSR family fosmidomycin resistance protein-like MFS transporter